MPDKILSAVTFDSVTNSYANVPVAQAPLLINDNGDLVFNTQNLSLYNSNSNNRILKNNFVPQYTDNVLIGSNNSYIFGQPHTIINSEVVYISGAYLHPDGNNYNQWDSISNSSYSCIINSYGSRLDSSYNSYISGSTWSSALNTVSSCIFGSCLSTVLGGQGHKLNGSWLNISSTGLVSAGSFRGGGSTIIGGGLRLCTVEANYDRQRFSGVLGTGWANQNNSSTVTFNLSSALLAGSDNVLVTSLQSSIIGGQNNCISGTTNGVCVDRSAFSILYPIAKWKINENNSIISSKNSKILDQVSESLILGGTNNCIVSQVFPWYYSGTDGPFDPVFNPTINFQNSRVVCNANIIGGATNIIREGSNCSSIIASTISTIESGSINSIILGGNSSKLCSRSCYSIAQGASSTINGCFSNIAGGYFNTISGNFNLIAGGQANRNCTQQHSVIVGGCANWICSGSNCSFIGGGGNHCIINSPYSYVIGGRCSIIQNSHCGAAVLGDGQNRSHASCNPHSLTLDFASGIYFAQTGVFGQINFSTTPQVGGTTVALSNDVVDLQNNQEVGGIKTFTSIPTVNGDNLALEYNIVDLFTNQYIEGVKTFSTTPQVVLTPVALSDNVVDLQNNQEVGGIKNFTSRPTVNSVPVLISGATSQIFTSPVSANSAGTSGQFVVDGDYFYFCKKDNTWIRTALSSW